MPKSRSQKAQIKLLQSKGHCLLHSAGYSSRGASGSDVHEEPIWRMSLNCFRHALQLNHIWTYWCNGHLSLWRLLTVSVAGCSGWLLYQRQLTHSKTASRVDEAFDNPTSERHWSGRTNKQLRFDCRFDCRSTAIPLRYDHSTTYVTTVYGALEIRLLCPRYLGGGIKRWCCLTSLWRLSVAYIGPKSRTKRPRKTTNGTEVANVTRDSDTTFKVKRSKVKVTGARHIVAASRTAYYCRRH